MPGARLTVEIDDTAALRALNRALAATRDMTPLMRDIGEELLTTTRERFVGQKSPEGTPWAPLSELTKKRKQRNPGKILTERGFLRGGLTYQAGPDAVLVGSPSIYAGTHQFGAKKGAFGSTHSAGYRDRGTDDVVHYSLIKPRPLPWADIPARPFLGLSADDSAEIVVLVNEYLAEQLS